MERSSLEETHEQKIARLRREYEHYRDARRKLFMARMIKGNRTASAEEKQLKKQMDAAYDLYQHELLTGDLSWHSETRHSSD
jgi:hypothetical protein